MKLFVIGCSIAFMCCSAIQHALKLSTTTITVEKGQLVFQTRMFADDLSECMRQYTKTRFPIEGEKISVEQAKHIERYFLEKFSLKVNSAPTTLQIKSIEPDFSDSDVTVIVVRGVIKGKFQSSNISKMSVKNTLLFVCAPEQKNIVNIQKIKPENKVLVFNSDQDFGYLDVELP